MKEILFYQLPAGRSPVEEYLDELTAKEVKKIAWVMQLIEELNRVPVNYYKPLKNCDGIVEVRVSVNKNSFRFLGFEYQGSFVVLTNGFKKKDQKTPKIEIDLALKRRKDYLSR